MKEIVIIITVLSIIVFITTQCSSSNKKGVDKGSTPFPTDRIPLIPFIEEPNSIEIQDESTWIEKVKASYPTGTQDGDIIRIISRLDRRCNSGLERHHSDICSVNTFDNMILVHAMRIDNFTELHGMREVYEECHQHVIDLWTLNDNIATRKRIHHHSDYVLGDRVDGLCLGGIWSGEHRYIKDIGFSPDGKSCEFEFYGKDINIQI